MTDQITVPADRPGQHVILHGVSHHLIPIESLELHAFYGRATVEYPSPAPGWATSVIENKRVCAWYEEAAS